MPPTPPEPVAIIGMGCRFPGGADSPEKLWEILCQGKDCFIDVPPDRWNNRKYYDPDPDKPGKMSVKQGGFLKESIFDFDPEFFGISPREAETLDPQQRLLLETTWEAIEDSGMTLPQLQSLKTGVFAGFFHLEHYAYSGDFSNTYAINTHTGINVGGTMMSNKISYLLDFRGPSLSADTACSSSLTTLELALTHLFNGSCDIALTGGVNCMHHPNVMVVLSKGHFLSDRSRAFGSGASGYGRGEGAGMLLLKPLKVALRDGNNIHAVIRHAKLNQDGRTPGITLPNRKAQAQLMEEVYQEAKVNSKNIRYFEAHGTGTDAGDKAEAWSINRVLSKGRSKKDPVYVGSIKTNIGHTEAAAGVAGVIKAALVLKHRKIPPSLHSSTLNPEIPFKDMVLQIPQRLISLPGPKTKPAFAGVNSFGYGGSNAHALLESPPQLKEKQGKKAVRAKRGTHCFLVPFSARHPNALKDLASRYATALSSPKVSLEDFCHSLVHHRTHHPLRAAVVAKSKQDLTKQFKLFSEGLTPATIVQGKTSPSPPKVLFVYPGVGPQWFAMGRELWKTQPVYKKTILECDKYFQKISGYSIVKELLKGKSNSKINRTEILQPAITAVQIGLTELWKAWGVRPDMIVGHSLGEIAAAYAAGGISLPTAIKIVAHRAMTLKKLSGKGGMLAVGLPPEEADKFIRRYRSKVSVAASNDAESLTLSGALPALKEISARLEKASVFNQFLNVDVPYHAPATERVIPEFRASIKNVKGNKPGIALYSTLLGKRVKHEKLDAGYWTDNIRMPVSFHKTLLAIAKGQVDAVVEVGPHPVLRKYLQKTLSQVNENVSLLHTLIREKPENQEMLITLGKLFTLGTEINWDAVIPSGGRYVSLPRYPWQRKRYWRESEESAANRLGDPGSGPFLQKKLNLPQPTWEADINPNYFPFLDQHKIKNQIVFPAAGYLEGMFSLMDKLEGPSIPKSLENVQFENMLVVQGHVNPLMQISRMPGSAEIRVNSTDPTSNKWVVNARAIPGTPLDNPEHCPTFFKRTFLEMQPESYPENNQGGIQYGPFFQVIKKIREVEGEVFVHLVQHHNSGDEFRRVYLIDGILQTVGLLNRKLLVPRSIKSLQLFRELDPSLFVHVKAVWQSDSGVIGNVFLWDEDGVPVGQMEEVHLTLVPTEKKTESSFLYGINLILPEGRNPSAPNGHTKAKDVFPQDLFDIRKNGQGIEVHINPKEPSLEGALDISASLLTEVQRLSTGGTEGELVKVHEKFPTPLASSARALLLCLRNENQMNISPMSVPGALEQLQKEGGKELNLFSHDWSFSVKPAPGPGVDTIFERSPCRLPLANEVGIKVFYSAINFKDLLKVTHRLPVHSTRSTYTGYSLGVECAGIVEHVGKNVSVYKPGDIVIAFSPSSMGSYLACQPESIFQVSKSLTLRENIVYESLLTAYYGLHYLARLEKGEKILIHNATGGVGLAAVQVAQWVGAEIISTAGSPEKRDYLSNQGIREVYPSRNLDFYPEIKNKHGGVDVVIGAVQDELLTKSFDLLLPGGRYIELGKKNILGNSGLPMGTFDRNISFFGVDVDRLAKEKPKLLLNLAKEIHQKLEQGIFKPLPTTVFPASKIKDAFTYMAQSKHIGRILIDWQNQKVPVTPTLEHDLLKPDATYIITGGLGGFGLEVSKWLVENGAKYVVPLSRSGPKSPEAKEAVAWMKKQGAEVKALSIDVSDIKQVRRMMQSIKKDFPEVRGVIHCAGVLDDKLAVDIDRKSLEKVFAPKVGGALNLHEATLGMPLDFFVCFSSIVSIVGNVGQANYAAANGFLDGFAPYRRSLGLPCTTINWGAIGETGMVAKDKNVEKKLAQGGIRPIPVKDALEALGKVMLNDLTNVGVFDIDWATWAKVNPKAAKSPFFSEVLKNINKPGQNGSAVSGFATELQEHVKKGGKALDFSLVKLSKELMSVLRMQDNSVDPNQPLNNLGVDSLLGTELTTRLQTNLGVEVSAFDIMRGITLKQLAEKVTEQVSGSTPSRN